VWQHTRPGHIFLDFSFLACLHNPFQIEAVAVKAATRIFTGRHPVISEETTFKCEPSRALRTNPDTIQGDADHLRKLENP